MTDSKPEGFQPAPWEAGKRQTQGPIGPKPGHGAPQGAPGYAPPPGPPPGPPPAPARPTRSSIPLGGGPAPGAFGGGDMGRARTRQIPNQERGPTIGQPFNPQHGSPEMPSEPPAYGGQPQGYAAQPPQGYAAQPPQYGQAQGQPYPPQGGPMPHPGAPYPQAGGQPQQPYGDPGFMPQKGITVFGIVALVLAGVGALAALVTFGFFSWPFFIIGGILGYLGIRETTAWGKKRGRGLAMGGTIANAALLVLNVAGLIALFALASTVENLAEQEQNAHHDVLVIEERIGKYHQAKGDLQPGGPQFKMGYENSTAVTGPQLTVPDLCTPGELQNPIEQYSLTIAGDTATVWWTPKDSQRRQIGSYPPAFRFDDFEFEDEFQASPPPPRRK